MFRLCLFPVLLYMASPAFAGVLLEVSDDGSDLTLQWTGSLDLGSVSSNTFNNDFGPSLSTASTAILDGSSFGRSFAGSATGNNPFLNGFGLGAFSWHPSSLSGSGLGFNGRNLYWDDAFGAAPGVVTPTGQATINNQTVSSVFGTNLDGGAVALWTLTATGDTISVGLGSSGGAVPEPSTVAILGFGALGLVVRRRNRRPILS